MSEFRPTVRQRAQLIERGVMRRHLDGLLDALKMSATEEQRIAIVDFAQRRRCSLVHSSAFVLGLDCRCSECSPTHSNIPN